MILTLTVILIITEKPTENFTVTGKKASIGTEILTLTTKVSSILTVIAKVIVHLTVTTK